MKNRKVILGALAIVIIITAAILLPKKTNSKNDSDLTQIGFLVPTLENPFFVEMTESAKRMESDKLKIAIQANQDELRQNQIIENFIIQGVDAICVVPINSVSIIPAIIELNKSSIPFINVDNKVDVESAVQQGAEIASYIGSDNYEGGKLAGTYIIEQLGGEGTVAILEGIAGNDAAINRKGGFEEAIKSAPDIKIVASQAADWSRQKANEIFQAILTANPNIDAVFACNDEMALGAIAASKTKGVNLDSIIIVGFDAIDEAISAVDINELDATIAQQPEIMGQRAIELAQQIISGNAVEQSYSTPLKIISK